MASWDRLRLMILITTNEELRNLHPAITRSGRCMANIEFTEFDRGEAQEWLSMRGSQTLTLPASLTIADLYAAAADTAPIANAAPPKAAGFTA